jgi:GNAT superfamily N-acetyltransferase
MDHVTIRPAGARDALAVAALALQMGLELGHEREAGFLDRYAAAWAGALDHRPTWLAEAEDGRPLGSVVTARIDKLPRLGRGDTCWLHVSSLFVTTTARGAGVGERLLRAVITWAGDHDVDRIQLNAVPQAKSLYERVGFVGPDQRLMELRR